MKKIFSKEVIIGFCVLLALCILFFGIEYLKGVNIFRPSNYYYAVYTDVKGLTTSAPVNVNGVKVGTVDRVELMYDRPGNVIVQFSIDKSLQLPIDTKAMIDSDLLGTASLRLDIAQNAKTYTAGDTIPSGIASGMMDKISGDLLPGITDVVPKIDTLLQNLNDLTGNPAIASSLANIEAITAQLRTTSSMLNKSVGQMPTLMNEVNSVVANIDSITRNLNDLTASIAEAPIDETLANINHISDRLAAVTDLLNNPDSNLGKLLHDSELYDNLVNATADIDSLLVDIKKNPKRYISIKLL